MCVNNSCYRNSNSYSPGKLLWLSKGLFSHSLSAWRAQGAAMGRDKVQLKPLHPSLLAGIFMWEQSCRV